MIVLCFHDRLRICEKHARAFPLPLPPAAGSWPVEHWEVSHATCSGWRRCQHATLRSKQASGLPLSFAFCLFLSAAWIAPTTTISKIWLFKKGKIWARVQQPIAAEAAHLFWGRRRVITQKICCVKKEVRCLNNGREVYLDVSVNLALGWFILEPPNQANMNLNKIEPQPGYKFVSIRNTTYPKWLTQGHAAHGHTIDWHYLSLVQLVMCQFMFFLDSLHFLTIIYNNCWNFLGC